MARGPEATARGGAEPAACSMIFTLALAPIRVAPAQTIFFKSSKLRTPPAAFTPISEPDHGAHQRNVLGRGPGGAEAG